VFAGGVAGTLARAEVARLLPAHGDGWPWATFAVNCAGALLIGLVVTRLQERLPPGRFARPLVGTGLCGALTTFSTFQVEILRIARDGHVLLAAGYLLASVAAGLALVYAATAAVRRVRLT
jgi:CrcB protein